MDDSESYWNLNLAALVHKQDLLISDLLLRLESVTLELDELKKKNYVSQVSN
jgi:hypothetical protein